MAKKKEKTGKNEKATVDKKASGQPKFITAITGSLLYRMFSILAALLLFMFLIFALVPKDAYIILKQDSKDIDIVNGRLTSFRWMGSEIEFSNFDELKIELGTGKTFHINGNDYDANYYMLIQKISDKGTCIINPSQTKEPLSCAGMDLGAKPHKQNITFHDYGALTIEGLEDYYFQSQTPVQIMPYGAAVYIFQGDQEIAYFSEENSGEISVQNCYGMSVVSNGNKAKLYGGMDLKATLEEVERFFCVGNGTIDYTYGNTNKEIESKEKPIILEAVDSSLAGSVTLQSDCFHLEASGMVKKASIAGSSIQPSFFNWLKESVYSLPSTILGLAKK